MLFLMISDKEAATEKNNSEIQDEPKMSYFWSVRPKYRNGFNDYRSILGCAMRVMLLFHV